jgi:hypothetical protein
MLAVRLFVIPYGMPLLAEVMVYTVGLTAVMPVGSNPTNNFLNAGVNTVLSNPVTGLLNVAVRSTVLVVVVSIQAGPVNTTDGITGNAGSVIFQVQLSGVTVNK